MRPKQKRYDHDLVSGYGIKSDPELLPFYKVISKGFQKIQLYSDFKNF